jgi:hypothetical protein
MSGPDNGRDSERRDRADFEVQGTRVSFGGASADRGDLVESYAAVLGSVRSTRPGDALQLRTDDLQVLALAIGADGHDVEARIRGLLGCTRDEARRIHKELVRRRLLQPVAALAVGTAIIWGPAAAAHSDRPSLGPVIESTTTTASTTAVPQFDVGTGPQMTSPSEAPIPTAAVVATQATLPTEQPTIVPAEPMVGATTTTAATHPVAVTPVEATRTDDQADVGIPAGETPTAIIVGPTA